MAQTHLLSCISHSHLASFQVCIFQPKNDCLLNYNGIPLKLGCLPGYTGMYSKLHWGTFQVTMDYPLKLHGGTCQVTLWCLPSSNWVPLKLHRGCFSSYIGMPFRLHRGTSQVTQGYLQSTLLPRVTLKPPSLPCPIASLVLPVTPKFFEFSMLKCEYLIWFDLWKNSQNFT